MDGQAYRSPDASVPSNLTVGENFETYEFISEFRPINGYMPLVLNNNVKKLQLEWNNGLNAIDVMRLTSAHLNVTELCITCGWNVQKDMLDQLIQSCSLQLVGICNGFSLRCLIRMASLKQHCHIFSNTSTESGTLAAAHKPYSKFYAQRSFSLYYWRRESKPNIEEYESNSDFDIADVIQKILISRSSYEFVTHKILCTL